MFVDAVWEAITDGARRQVLFFHSHGSYYAYVYKADQKKMTLTVEGTQPDLYQLEVPVNRYEQHKTKIDVVSQFLEATEEYTANMQLEEKRRTGNADEIVERVNALTMTKSRANASMQSWLRSGMGTKPPPKLK